MGLSSVLFTYLRTTLKILHMHPVCSKESEILLPDYLLDNCQGFFFHKFAHECCSSVTQAVLVNLDMTLNYGIVNCD